MLSNIGFDGPPTVYTVGLVIVRGIISCIEWLPYLRQWCGFFDGDIWLARLRKRARRSHQLPPRLCGHPCGDGHQEVKGFFFFFFFFLFFLFWDFPTHSLCSGGAGCVVATWCGLRGEFNAPLRVTLGFPAVFGFLCLAF